jgi:hypothetical protein
MDESDRQELSLRELVAIFSDTNLSLSTIRECFERHNFDFDETFDELCNPATDWSIADSKVPATKSIAQSLPDPKLSADSKSRKAPRKTKSSGEQFMETQLIGKQVVDAFVSCAVCHQTLCYHTGEAQIQGGKALDHKLSLVHMRRTGVFQCLLRRFAMFMIGERYFLKLAVAPECRTPEETAQVREVVEAFFKAFASSAENMDDWYKDGPNPFYEINFQGFHPE